MIDACQRIADVRRAHEWTTALAAWWGTQPDMLTFTGQCLVHRAEAHAATWRMAGAVEATKRACDRLAHAADKYATGQRCTGRRKPTESAEILGRRSTPTAKPPTGGTKPSPAWPCSGWLRTRLRRPRRRSPCPRRDDGPADAGEVPSGACRDHARHERCPRRHATHRDELLEIAKDIDTPALRAVAGHAQGAVRLREGDARGALVAVRRHREMAELDAPYEAARARVLIGYSAPDLGDEDSARLGSMPLTGSSALSVPLRTSPGWVATKQGAAVAHGADREELEVLRLLATGKTNHAVATGWSGRQDRRPACDKHVFCMPGSASRPRAAATAYAYDHHLR